MAPRVQSRRSARSVVRLSANKSSRTGPVISTLSRIVRSRQARTAYYVLGTAGLVALAVAVVGPKRLEREVIKPLRSALEPQAEKLWADSRPLRQQIAQLFKSAGPSGRERLVRSFQSWIGHFHAT
ncbi:MAG TPA: hypothetical protein VH189_08820 [Rhizomicrobium sp.]|nr:hypothetical protein [Rhizomicrobium sp.]